MGSLAWGAITACAQQNDALFVWADGSETCYQLDQMPKVVYDGGKAFVYVREQTNPVITFVLSSNQKIVMRYGRYIPPEEPSDHPTVVEVMTDDMSVKSSKAQKIINENGMMVDVNKDGLYWTSTLDTYNNNSAYGLITRFSEGNAGVLTGIDNRQYARVIRAVRK